MDPVLQGRTEEMIQKILTRIAVGGILIGLAVALFFIWNQVKEQFGVVTPLSNTFILPTPTPDPLAPRGVLLLGYGGGKHEGGSLTDTMILAYIVPKAKRVMLITIPRDVWVDLPLTKNSTIGYKINAAYAIGTDAKIFTDRPKEYKGNDGGINLASFAVARFTGIPISDVIALSFDGFKNAVNSLGGIELNVPFSFTDEFYPLDGKEQDICGKSEDEMKMVIATTSGFIREQQFSCRFEKLVFEKGLVQMDADTALKFVRSRHSDVNGGDFGRSLRQQAFLKAVKSKLLSLAGLGKLIPFVSNIFKSVDTNLTVTDVAGMIQTYGDLSVFELSTLPLTDENVLEASTSADGQYILVAKDGIGSAGILSYIQSETQKISSPSAVK
jgi:polyisoprenyl-teichoic acid--peptidoglycan teichoic acid transferase